MEVRIIKCGSLGDLMSFIEDEMGREIKTIMENMEKGNAAEEKMKDADQVKECCTSNPAEIPQTPWGGREAVPSAHLGTDKRAEDAEMIREGGLRERNKYLMGQLIDVRNEITKLCSENADLKSRVRSLEDYAMRVERITSTSPLLKERCPQIPACDKNETAPRTV